MRYDAFLAKVRAFPVISSEICSVTGESLATIRLQFSRWVRSGRLLRLKRGLYALPTHFTATPFSPRWLANALYSPSYLSLEYVLAYYDLIPERVVPLTSVTALKTASFRNVVGHFTYRHLKPALFFGFEERQDEYDRIVLMATPEKALLDYIYFARHWESTPAFVEQNLRLQNMGQLRTSRLRQYGEPFASKKIAAAVRLFTGTTTRPR